LRLTWQKTARNNNTPTREEIGGAGGVVDQFGSTVAASGNANDRPCGVTVNIDRYDSGMTGEIGGNTRLLTVNEKGELIVT
jgi:hypothetical protein